MSKPTILERLEYYRYMGDDPIPDAIRYIEKLEERVKELEAALDNNLKFMSGYSQNGVRSVGRG